VISRAAARRTFAVLLACTRVAVELLSDALALVISRADRKNASKSCRPRMAFSAAALTGTPEKSEPCGPALPPLMPSAPIGAE
jgi:hypothetical protein